MARVAFPPQLCASEESVGFRIGSILKRSDQLDQLDLQTSASSILLSLEEATAISHGQQPMEHDQMVSQPRSGDRGSP